MIKITWTCTVHIFSSSFFTCWKTRSLLPWKVPLRRPAIVHLHQAFESRPRWCGRKGWTLNLSDSFSRSRILTNRLCNSSINMHVTLKRGITGRNWPFSMCHCIALCLRSGEWQGYSENLVQTTSKMYLCKPQVKLVQTTSISPTASKIPGGHWRKKFMTWRSSFAKNDAQVCSTGCAQQLLCSNVSPRSTSVIWIQHFRTAYVKLSCY